MPCERVRSISFPSPSIPLSLSFSPTSPPLSANNDLFLSTNDSFVGKGESCNRHERVRASVNKVLDGGGGRDWAIEREDDLFRKLTLNKNPKRPLKAISIPNRQRTYWDAKYTRRDSPFITGTATSCLLPLFSP